MKTPKEVAEFARDVVNKSDLNSWRSHSDAMRFQIYLIKRITEFLEVKPTEKPTSKMAATEATAEKAAKERKPGIVSRAKEAAKGAKKAS